MNMEIAGTKGSILITDDSAAAAHPGQLPFAGHRKCFEAFADSLEGGEPYPIPGEEGRKASALIEAIYRSAGIFRP